MKLFQGWWNCASRVQASDLSGFSGQKKVRYDTRATGRTSPVAYLGFTSYPHGVDVDRGMSPVDI